MSASAVIFFAFFCGEKEQAAASMDAAARPKREKYEKIYDCQSSRRRFDDVSIHYDCIICVKLNEQFPDKSRKDFVRNIDWHSGRISLL